MKGFKYIPEASIVIDTKLRWIYNAFPNGGFNLFPKIRQISKQTNKTNI